VAYVTARPGDRLEGLPGYSISLRSGHRVRWLSQVVVALVFVMSFATVASAAQIDNIMPTSTTPGHCVHGGALETSVHVPCQTDNATTGFWMESSIDRTTGSDTTAEASINATMSGSYNGTDLNTSYDSTPVFSGAGETDMVYRAKNQDFNDSGQNLIGYMWCDDVVNGSAYRCDQAYINFINAGSVATRALACHETGHAVGLLHGEDAAPVTANDSTIVQCMATPIINSRPYLGTNNVSNINSVY
jgi:hypothetical protein